MDTIQQNIRRHNFAQMNNNINIFSFSVNKATTVRNREYLFID